MPAIRQRLLERFGPSRLHEPERGDLAIAAGAAWIAHDRTELRLAKPIEVLLASGNYVPLVRAGTALPREGQDIKLPDLDLYCADPRDGHAKIELARPRRPTALSTASPRVPYDYLLVKVDPNAQPLRERVELRGTIDQDLVVRLSARSTLRGDAAATEVMDLEFGLDLRDGNRQNEDPESEETGIPAAFKPSHSAVLLRPNVTFYEGGLLDVPGELISELLPFIPWPGYRHTDRQRAEEGYYLPCARCRRTMYDLESDGCDWCAARRLGPSTEEAAKRRMTLSAEEASSAIPTHQPPQDDASSRTVRS
jgi:hypothetical protein